MCFRVLPGVCVLKRAAFRAYWGARVGASNSCLRLLYKRGGLCVLARAFWRERSGVCVLACAFLRVLPGVSGLSCACCRACAGVRVLACASWR